MKTVDLGGSLAVASKGLYSTGVSTDLNGKVEQRRESIPSLRRPVTYINSGGKVGDTLRAVSMDPLMAEPVTDDNAGGDV